MDSKSHLIIGCGYLGVRLRDRIPGQNCWYTNRQANQHVATEKHLALDINDEQSWKVLTSLERERELVIYLMIPPSRINTETLPCFLEKLDQLDVSRRILVSSTVVYGQEERVVDADSDVIIDSDRARRQHQIEQLWMRHAGPACVLRLAGIYGPGRVIGQRAITSGEPLSGDPQAWLNLIHVDDAASLLEALSRREHVADFELGCDGMPLSRGQYYGMLAELLNCPAPHFQVPVAASERGRRCNNALTVARTGWLPQHTDIRDALLSIVHSEEPDE